MGFLDKARKLAEQAQQAIEEQQTKFNESQSGATPGAGAPVEYDQHGRPIARDEAVSGAPAAPHGDPVATPPAPVPAAEAEPSGPERPHGDPLAPAVPSAPEPEPEPSSPPSSPQADPGVPDTQPEAPPPAAQGGVPQDRNTVDYTPPQVTSGDPLAG